MVSYGFPGLLTVYNRLPAVMGNRRIREVMPRGMRAPDGAPVFGQGEGPPVTHVPHPPDKVQRPESPEIYVPPGNHAAKRCATGARRRMAAAMR